MLELNLILVFIIIGAIAAIEIKDMLSSVIALGAVGFGVSAAFLLLKAPDLAITQLVVEILCVIILIRATIRVDLPFSTSGRWLVNTIITVVFLVVFMSFAYYALKDLPLFGEPQMRISKAYLEMGRQMVTGSTNLVSSVILDFRAYDTLGEATILFTAVIGLAVIMRKIGRKK